MQTTEERKNLIKGDAGSELNVFSLRGKGKNNLEYLLKKLPQNTQVDLNSLKQQVYPTDLATIIYTSGTTGVPKRAILTHKNLMNNLYAMMPLIPFDASKRAISLLPYSYIFERSAVYTYLAMGCSLYLPGGEIDILTAFKQVRPHLFTAVPRILEKIYEGVLAYQAKQSFLRKKIIDWALKVGLSYKEEATFRPLYAFKHHVANCIEY